jgi:hypothetical protein
MPKPKPPEGPWDAAGNLQMPGWLQGAAPMPELWPVFHFWMMVGRETLKEAEAHAHV